MKGLTRILLLSCVSIAGLYACRKVLSTSSPSENTKTDTLTLSASSVKTGEPLVASLPSAVTVNAASWTARPDSGVRVTPSGRSATFTFSAAGTYYITAYITDSLTGAHDSCTAPITVTDSVYTIPRDTISLAGKQLILSPQSAGDSGVYMLLTTVDTFPCRMAINMGESMAPGGDSIYVNWAEAQGSNHCTGPGIPISNSFRLSKLAPGSSSNFWIFLPDGEGTFEFTMTATSTGYTFNALNSQWSPITLDPATIQD
jgi:hypothetical protein